MFQEYSRNFIPFRYIPLDIGDEVSELELCALIALAEHDAISISASGGYPSVCLFHRNTMIISSVDCDGEPDLTCVVTQNYVDDFDVEFICAEETLTIDTWESATVRHLIEHGKAPAGWPTQGDGTAEP